MAVAEELATEVRAEGGVAGTESVPKMLVGAHGAGAVLDDVEGFGFRAGQRPVLQGERWKGIVRAAGGLAVAVLGILREEGSDVGALPRGR